MTETLELKTGWDRLTEAAAEYAALAPVDPHREELLAEVVGNVQPYLRKLAGNLLSGGGVTITTKKGKRIISAHGSSATVEDLVQEGAIALVKSLGRYKVSLGAFSTFAHTVAAAGMRDAAKKKYNGLVRNEPFDSAYLAIDDLMTQEESYGAHMLGEEDCRHAMIERKQFVEVLFAALQPKEQHILKLQFGFYGEEHTVRSVGERYDVSSERIRQLTHKAFRKMRRYAFDENLIKKWC